VSFNATGAKRYLANGVAADIEDDPGGNQFQIIAGAYTKDVESDDSVGGAPSRNSQEEGSELTFGVVAQFNLRTTGQAVQQGRLALF
jgi:hypothetical protein